MFESTAVSSVILRAAQRGEPRAQPTALLEPSCILHGEIRRQEDAVLVHVFCLTLRLERLLDDARARHMLLMNATTLE